MAKNSRKKYEVKINALRSNAVKRASHIIKRGRLFNNILSTEVNFNSVTKTTNDFTDSSYNLKDAFYHFGGNISDLLDLKK